MSWTRREFLTTAGLGVSAAAAGAELSLFSETTVSRPFPRDGPAYLVGDPYLAAAEGPGLGGRSFAQARHRALRFRTPPADRDRSALGLLPEDTDA